MSIVEVVIGLYVAVFLLGFAVIVLRSLFGNGPERPTRAPERRDLSRGRALHEEREWRSQNTRQRN